MKTGFLLSLPEPHPNPFNLTPTPLPRERGFITDIQCFTSPSLLGEGERGGEVNARRDGLK
jgi:hypothetical protein